jgi:hypothetical protein
VVVLPPHVKGTILSATRSLFTDNAAGSDAGGTVTWAPRRASTSIDVAKDVLQSIRLPRGAGRVAQLVFHRKGDYFSSLCKFHDIIRRHPKPLFESCTPLTHRSTPRSCFGQWHGPKLGLDSPSEQAAFTGSIQEYQRDYTKDPVSPQQAPFSRRST